MRINPFESVRRYKAHQEKMKSFTREGEKFLFNTHLVDYNLESPSCRMQATPVTPEEYVDQLLQTGLYESVRVDPDAAFNMFGETIPGDYAVFVTRKPEE